MLGIVTQFDMKRRDRMSNSKDLKKALTPLHLWAIGVGIVISGNYFGWNFAVQESGYIGMLIATGLMALMYTAMCLGIAELSTILPHAGGPYAFARRAMGPLAGFLTGFGVILEYVIAGPIVAIGIGAYVNFLFPSISPLIAAVILYAFFIGIHLLGVKEYATFEMVIVFIAVGLLVLLYFVGLPQVKPVNLFGENGDSLLPTGIAGIWAALPYAMWLFLAIEVLPMLSEETRDAKKDMPKGILSGMVTLLILSVLTVTVAIGLGGTANVDAASDPLPAAVAATFGENYWLAQVLATIGLFGLIASFSGVILAYSRQIFALSRAGYLPKFLSQLHKKRRTPYWALILPGVLGLLLVWLFNADHLILISTFGALVSYIAMNLSVIMLRKKEPDLVRSFKTPLFPITPIVSIVLACIALLSSFFSNITVFIVSLGIFACAIIYYYCFAKANINADAPEEQGALQQNNETILQEAE